MWRLLLIWLSLVLAIPAWAQTEESISINDELEIPVTLYPAFSAEAPILIWLPSSRGTSSRQSITADGLADLGIETWIIDLHTAYFIDPGRSSVQHFLARDIADLIGVAARQSKKKVYLIATDSVAKPALQAIALYQHRVDQHLQTPTLGGAILFHPALSYPATEAGKSVDYVPAAKNSTIPIYYIQPSISTRQSRSREILETLQSGGSPVFFHPMPGISAGFHLRSDDDMSDADIAQRANLPNDIKRAIALLAMQPTPKPPAAYKPVAARPSTKAPRYGLKALQEHSAPPLSLNDMQAQAVSIDYTSNRLTLVSFWASWCEPCIRELPPLKRLYDDFHDHGLTIVTVNMGETAEAIQPVVEGYGMSAYTNLSDPEGEIVNEWNVYAFPTNFLVTSEGLLSHGSIGGVDWDDAGVRETVAGLLSQE